MMLLVNGATRDVEPLINDPCLGVLVSPGTKGGGPKNDIKRIDRWGVKWGVDNGCFGGLDESAFLRLLAAVTVTPKCMWVTAPDVVGDSRETLRKFSVWGPLIKELRLPVALVSQDGLTPDAVPWSAIDALFVGGTDAWKLCDESVHLCREAKDRGKLVHVGRVNSKIRIRAAMAIGADSVDGSQFSWWPERYVPTGLRWIRESEAQLASDHAQMRFGPSVLQLAVDQASKFYAARPQRNP